MPIQLFRQVTSLFPKVLTDLSVAILSRVLPLYLLTYCIRGWGAWPSPAGASDPCEATLLVTAGSSVFSTPELLFVLS